MNERSHPSVGHVSLIFPAFQDDVLSKWQQVGWWMEEPEVLGIHAREEESPGTWEGVWWEGTCRLPSLLSSCPSLSSPSLLFLFFSSVFIWMDPHHESTLCQFLFIYMISKVHQGQVWLNFQHHVWRDLHRLQVIRPFSRASALLISWGAFMPLPSLWKA